MVYLIPDPQPFRVEIQYYLISIKFEKMNININIFQWKMKININNLRWVDNFVSHKLKSNIYLFPW